MKFSFFLLMVVSFFSYGQKDTPLIGRWEMEQVIQDGNDVSAEHNPKSNRFIIFKDDGSFESGGDPYGKNTGKFFYDLSQSRLMLDSDSGAGDDSMWIVEFEKNKLIWRGIGSEWAEQFRLIHKKVKE